MPDPGYRRFVRATHPVVSDRTMSGMRTKPGMRLLFDDRMSGDCDVLARTWDSAQALLMTRDWDALHLGVGRSQPTRHDGLALVEWALAHNRLPVRVLLLSKSVQERHCIGTVLRRSGWASADGRRFLRLPAADESAPYFPRIRIIGVNGPGGGVTERMIAARIGGTRILVVQQELPVVEQTYSPVASEDAGTQAGREMAVGDACHPRLQEWLEDADLVLIVPGRLDAASLDLSATIAAFARDQGILTLAIVDPRSENPDAANPGLVRCSSLASQCDAVLEIPDHIAGVTTKRARPPSLFEITAYLASCLVDTMTFPSWVNLDFNAFCYAFRGASRIHTGIGSADVDDRAVVASLAAMQSLALNAPNLRRLDRLVVVIDAPRGGFAMDEVQEVVSTIEACASPDTFVTCGSVRIHGDASLHVIVMAAEFAPRPST